MPSLLLLTVVVSLAGAVEYGVPVANPLPSHVSLLSKGSAIAVSVSNIIYIAANARAPGRGKSREQTEEASSYYGPANSDKPPLC